MLIENQKIKMQWNSANKEHYEAKGYIFTHVGDCFYVNIEDLTSTSKVNVKIKCDGCGKEYFMTYYGYKKGYERSVKNNDLLLHFCDECKFRRSQDSLYDRAVQMCEKKGYILLSEKSDILCNTSCVEYLCPLHGKHEMRINNLINGRGCPDCVALNNSEKFRLSPDEVESRISQCGGNLLNKHDYKNQSEKNLLVECFECGRTFLTSLRNYTQHGGQVCDKCKSTESVGEKRIRHYLESNIVEFVAQKWFKDCRDKNPLPFDFYLPIHNIIIEFDGRQHFGETEYFTYSFEQTKKHDEIKNNYCKANGIYLIRIPYWHIDKIEQILDKELILHEDIV